MRHLMPILLSAGIMAACAFDTSGHDSAPLGDVPEPDPPSAEPRPEPRAAVTCYFATDLDRPVATLEETVEAVQGVEQAHVRLTVDPRFVDNTYGAGSLGWGPKGHAFKDIVGSDHAQIGVFDGAGALVADLKLDYLSPDPASPSGYGTLGVNGGDGQVLVGSPSMVLEVSTSLARNLNQRGWSSFVTSSPTTDKTYTPNPMAPDWDFLVRYEVVLRLDAFGAAGFGEATVVSLHASPAKTGTTTVPVTPGPCPPGWGGL